MKKNTRRPRALQETAVISARITIPGKLDPTYTYLPTRTYSPIYLSTHIENAEAPVSREKGAGMRMCSVHTFVSCIKGIKISIFPQIDAFPAQRIRKGSAFLY